MVGFTSPTDNNNNHGIADKPSYKMQYEKLLQLVRKDGILAIDSVLWSGKVNMTVIGDSDDQPDMVLVVEYPSAAKFVEMSTSEAYRAIAHDRELSLTYGGLLASATSQLGG